MQMELQDTPFIPVYTPGNSPEQGLADWVSRLKLAPTTLTSSAPHPRDVGARADTPHRLIERLAELPEFRQDADPAASAVAWLSGAPATTAALAVWPAAATAPRPALAALYVAAIGGVDNVPDEEPLDASEEIYDSDEDVRPEPPESDDHTPLWVAADHVPVSAPDTPAPPADPSAPLSRIAGGAQRNAAWRASVDADVALTRLRDAGAADRAHRVRWPTAFYDDEGLLRVPRVSAPSDDAVLDRVDGSQIVVPRSRVDEVIATYHHGMFGGHFDPLAAISRGWWWPTRREDVERMRHSCVQCQAFAAVPTRGEAAFTGADAAPLATVSIDLAAMPTSSSGMKFILVMIDACTGAIEAAALPNKAAVTTSRAFTDYWLARYAVPLTVMSDNGKEFEGEWIDIAAQFGFEHRRSAPYNPQGNGMAERAVQTTKRRLEKLCVSANQADWPAHLPIALASVRMHSGVRGASPFELSHGIPPRLPALARLTSGTRTTSSSLPPPTPAAVAQAVISRARAMISVAQARRLARQQANAARIGRQHIEPLCVGDVVLWRAQAANSKFAARRHWVGPFIIISESPIPGHFQLGRPDGAYATQRFVPARQLKLFVGDPYAADSAAILAEPGSRPWLGLETDRQLLGDQFAATLARAGT